MANEHDLEMTIDIGDDEVDVYVIYTATAGYAGCGPSLNHPGDPPEPPEVDLIKITRLDNEEELSYDSLSESTQQKMYEYIVEQEWERQNNDYPEYD